MEAAEVGVNESAAGTSLAIAATASAGTEDSVMTNESTLDMPTEITAAGTSPELPRSNVQYSTDLRKELSLDVLSSLGGLAADHAKAIDESILDLASVRADMDFISELSSLGLPLDQEDTCAPGAFSPSSTTILAESHDAPDSDGAAPTSDVVLPQSSPSARISESPTRARLEGVPGDDSSLGAPFPDSVESLSYHLRDELLSEVPLTSSLQQVINSTSSGVDAMVEYVDPVSSVLPVTLSSQENPGVPDASAELHSLRPGESELTATDPAASEIASAAGHSPVEPVSPVAPSSARAGNEAYHDSPKPSPSSLDPSLASPVSPVGHVTACLRLESLSFGGTEILDSALEGSEPLPVALEPTSLTSAYPVENSFSARVVTRLSEIQYYIPGANDIPEAPVTFLESYPAALETLPSPHSNPPTVNSPMDIEDSPLASTPGANDIPESPVASDEPSPAVVESLPSALADPLTPNSPMDIENSPRESTTPPSPVAASGYDGVVDGSSAFPPPPASGDVFFSNFSPTSNFTPLEQNLSPSFSKVGVLDSSRASSSPLVVSALDTTVPDAARAPFSPSLAPAKVPLFSDSVASPPLTARFWDVPSVSPGISLSAYFDGSRSSFRGRKINRKKRPSEAGADLKDLKGKGLSDVGKLEEVAELESMLDSQKRMVKWQIDEIQRIATLQFQLTGSNPLSEQAMRDVLGVKGAGRKGGDALSPVALKSLHEMFSIKDTLTKKEARDISFTYGASLTQVRDYFAGQRSLVRKFVQQAHDEVGRLGIKNASEQSQQIAVSNSISEVEKDLGFDKLSGPESIEKVIEVMRAEKGFAGQIQLLQVILRTDSPALILRRFLEKGALKMLGGWLVEAVAEQQTSVISHLLKVLDHLPISNAVSHQMPPLVQNVNKLRFHQASAVAGQARSLLTKWVKLLSPKAEGKSASSPGSKSLAVSATPSGSLKRNRDPPAAQIVPGTRKKKVRAEEALQQETKASQIAGSDSPSLNGMPQGATEPPSSSQVAVPAQPPPKPKWSSTLQPSESAVAAVSVSRKRLGYKSLGDQAKDRRKLMRVEDNHIGKSMGSKPATISKTSRPLSTDDIYKAKKLERLMQEPILKSKRKSAAAQEQLAAQAVVPKKPSPPAVPADIGVVNRETLSSSQGGWRGRSLTAKSVREDQPTATRTQLPIRSSEHRDIKATIAPTSPQDLFHTIITPTSSLEQVHLGSIKDGLTDDTASKRDSSLTALMETEQRPSTVLWSSGQELSGSSHFGNSTQLPTAVVGMNSAVSDAAPSVLSHRTHSSQPSTLENNYIAAPMVELKHSVEENVCIPPASMEPLEVRSDDVSEFSVVRGVTNPSDKSADDVSGSKVELGLGQEMERGGNDLKPLPRETSLSDYYALLRSTMIRWRIPPEYQPDEQWNVAAGEDSKEREVQSARVKREEEAYYPELAAVPADPKDPWEEEPDYDDSLTLQIFLESGQRRVSTEVNDLSTIPKSQAMHVVHYGQETSFGSDVSSSKLPSSTLSPTDGHEPAAELLSKAPTMNGLGLVLQQLSTGGGGGTHDPDLLALLLRNPQLVSQLTSGQAFTPTSNANPGVFMQPLDPLKQLSSAGNNGAGLSNPAGGLGQERLIPSNNSKALGIPLQPGRSVSSVDQTPPETMRVQDSIPMMTHPGMGQQQTMGFVPQGGVDNRFLTPQIQPLVPRTLQDASGWEHLRVPPPPPPVPPTQPVINQVFQPPLPNQPNKQSNWHESQGWVGVGRLPQNPSQTRSVPEQLHTRQTLMTHNVRVPNYPGMVGVPQVEVGSEPSVVSQPEVHHNQRPWSNGSHGGPTHESTMMHGGQDSGASRNNRWPRPPPVRPTNQHVRPGSRELTDFNNGRQTSVVDNRSAWVQSERPRPVLPPFQGAYTLPPPPPYPAPVWQGQDGSMRLVQGSAVNPFPHGRDLRPPQQQMWQNNTGPAPRQGWRGQQ